MGTTLTGTTPQDTYDSLIKVTDNGPLSGTAKYLSDGLGNDSVLALSTSRVGVGTNAPSYDLTLSKSVAAGNVVLQIENTSTTGSARLWFGNNANAAGARIQYFGATHAQRPNLFSIGTDAANDVVFETSGSERMRITSAGNVGIGLSNANVKLDVLDTMRVQAAGQAIFYLSNGVVQHQIVIEANPNNKLAFKWNGTERMALTTDGLTFNGDSAAANALDDYEEGTWTPSLIFSGGSTGITYTTQAGKYVKIGSKVSVNCYVVLSNKGSSTGSARIDGLPFTVPNAAGNYSPAIVLLDGGITYTGQAQGFANINSTSVALGNVTEAGSATALTDTNFSNSSAIMISLTYLVS